MKTLIFALGTTFLFSGGINKEKKIEIQGSPTHNIKSTESSAQEKIQVALLLDTSSSMDGLIDQAKSRLWNVVNTLTTLRYNGKKPIIEISLYEYGNDGLPADGGYIRQVTPLTSELDLLSEKLFALRTNGGLEYCGQVIQTSTNELKWDNNKNSMKLIYIAGNEAFNQGEINYVEAISDAVKKGIYVNTIHCGTDYSGQNGMWKDGAEKGKGEYFFIDHNQKIRYIPTPYDLKIDEYNTKLNETYLYYGREGSMMKERQMEQDMMAAEMSEGNKITRAAAKATYGYSNANWDLIDAVNQKEVEIENIDRSTLPDKYKGMTTKQLQAEVEKLNRKRTNIQKEIMALSIERENFIQAELKKSGETSDLGKAITDGVLRFAVAHGYSQR